MKHKPFFIILLTLAAALCLSALAFAAEAEPAAEAAESAPLSDRFTDLSYSENETALRFMIDGGLIAGYTDGTFRPGRSYTRLELAQLVTALCDLETASDYQSGFYDCALAGTEAIDAAVANELMTGRSIQSFDPYGNVLKAEMLGTLEKAAAYLQLEGFYDHASGSYTDWATDYTICTADEAMQAAYQLAQALALKAEAEAEAAAAEAAANAVSELTGAAADAPSGEMAASDEMSSYDQMTASAEPPEGDALAPTEDEQAEATEPTSSNEPSGEASAEPTDTTQQQQQSGSEPPAGVTTPASSATTPAQTTQTTPPSEVTVAAPVTEEYDESDELRNEVKGKYADIRDSILAFLRDLLGV